MGHTSLGTLLTLDLIGVFMTASEANHQRILTLLLFEEEQMRARDSALEKEIPAARRAKLPMSEPGRLSISDLCETIQSNAS
jgi:hypothetical protein